MATKYILDTHALIWHLEGNPLLGPNAKAVINTAASQLILPSIALAEAMYVVEKGRTAIPAVNHLMHDIGNDARIEVFPLTLGILEESAALTAVPKYTTALSLRQASIFRISATVSRY